ncbi:MAG: hypothetical protein GTN62_14080 [Gemmatimonadales bacterium]|nr:hypothetical protein [Gemmatimonadales bacterium]NIN13132.1 hypothetical protein [Gemmatimonadales bacterium]NIN51216.1 hypothetical protein [Gemmatimonadales bacterium]NIP08680.1 hypothetical protein [Gemmatimonadales bacterium]NIR02368.1 hypothetical protein [Gemmatimonadales bacterium]
MLRRSGWISGLVLLVVAGSAQGQATGLSTFNAPYRAFARHEFGGTLTFPEVGGTALEGQFRFGYRQFDIGVRGGFWDPGELPDTRILLGAIGRHRVITHTEDFPLDGAVVVGLGAQIVENFTTLFIPAGLSLGRRLDIEDSPVSIVPYVQPTLFLTAGSNQDTELNFAFGLGADFRLSRVFDARVGVGLGKDPLEGFSISAVWIR